MNDRNPEGQVRGPRSRALRALRHVQRVTSARGSTFYLCRLSFVDSRFARYPPCPCLACSGFTPASREEEGNLAALALKTGMHTIEPARLKPGVAVDALRTPVDAEAAVRRGAG